MSSIATNHYCIFESNHAHYAVSAAHIREITTRPRFAAALPRQRNLAGIWHEGSEFLPILRLPFESDEPQEPEREQQILVIQGANGHWCLLIDRVITVAELEYTLCTEQSEWSAVILGMSKLNEHSIRVLSLDGIYRITEQFLKQAWNDQLAPSTPSPTGAVA